MKLTPHEQQVIDSMIEGRRENCRIFDNAIGTWKLCESHFIYFEVGIHKKCPFCKEEAIENAKYREKNDTSR